MSGNNITMEKPKMERSIAVQMEDLEDLYSDDEEDETTTTTNQNGIVVVDIEIFRNSIIPNNYVYTGIFNTTKQ